MTTLSLRKFFIFLCVGLFSLSTTAGSLYNLNSKLIEDEYLPDEEDAHNFYEFEESRAKISYMGMWLLTPKQEWIWVDADLTCGSRWAHIGVMIKSRYGAELVAAGLSAKYGSKVGDDLLKMWSNKAMPNDARLPTYIVVYDSENNTADAMPPKAAPSCGMTGGHKHR